MASFLFAVCEWDVQVTSGTSMGILRTVSFPYVLLLFLLFLIGGDGVQVLMFGFRALLHSGWWDSSVRLVVGRGGVHRTYSSSHRQKFGVLVGSFRMPVCGCVHELIISRRSTRSILRRIFVQVFQRVSRFHRRDSLSA